MQYQPFTASKIPAGTDENDHGKYSKTPLWISAMQAFAPDGRTLGGQAASLRHMTGTTPGKQVQPNYPGNSLRSKTHTKVRAPPRLIWTQMDDGQRRI
ncbi:hypothetical protein QYQ35_30465 (plasmid) [Klebsiella pneumoniae]|uniref:hypothetical protein n=1 Tax=Klebsiella pneumoniae TaxID=573 RepID=UPI002658ED7E|nr:hypothetical protein [Klebsiella pneumoniae]WKI44762.1 hypothetical protein QYQ35_30465 [Klebsiella pneumoniae]